MEGSATLHWCETTSMDARRRGRHDKVREDLHRNLEFGKDSWERKADGWILRMPDQNPANRPRQDVPDYLLSASNGANLLVLGFATQNTPHPGAALAENERRGCRGPGYRLVV